MGREFRCLTYQENFVAEHKPNGMDGNDAWSFEPVWKFSQSVFEICYHGVPEGCIPSRYHLHQPRPLLLLWTKNSRKNPTLGI